MAVWLKTYAIPVLIGVVLAVLPVCYVVYIGVSWQPLDPHEHLIQNGFAYVFLLLFTYLNHTVFVPRWFLAKRYVRYAVVVAGCIVGLTFLPYRIEQWFYFKPPAQNTPLAWINQVFRAEMMLERPTGPFHPHTGTNPPDNGPPRLERQRPPNPPNGSAPSGRPRFRPRNRPFEPPLSAKLVIFFLIGSVSTLLSVSIQTANRLRRVETDQLRAELRQLKAQIHPHFLFNTLNSIYALSIRQDARTPDTIVKLAEFMRYIIRDAHRDKVPLLTEVNYIANYIDLQQARLRDAVQVDYRLAGDGSPYQIAPLLLFSFIENAFKYGVNPDEDSPIAIHLRIDADELHLHITNNKVSVSQLEPSMGVGLHNAQERLRLLYPAAHELTIDETATHFRVDLRLTLS